MVSPSVTVVYCTDHATARPMRVSAALALHSLAEGSRLHIHVVHKGLHVKDAGKLVAALDRQDREYTLSLHRLDEHPYEELPRFHGSLMPYAILHLPDYVSIEEAERPILYLDSDTLPFQDLTAVNETDLNGHALGAVCWDMTAGNAQERQLFETLGIESETPVFNTGVVLIDASAWREKRITERCLSIGAAHRADVVGDQTLLNAVLAGDFAQLPWRFNVRLGPSSAPWTPTRGGIAHFVGRKKPWTPFARHGNVRLWRKALEIVGE